VSIPTVRFVSFACARGLGALAALPECTTSMARRGQDLDCSSRSVNLPAANCVRLDGRAKAAENAREGGILVRKSVIVRIGLLMSAVAALALAGGASRGVR
jgi:hypothetical protein